MPEDEMDISAIKIRPNRLRQLQPAIVSGLADSISTAGLINAIQVDEEGYLIAGWHRLEAAKKLGWQTIRTIVVEDRSADLMRITEIDENLMRAELSAIERSLHQEERKRCYEREFPETRHVSERGGPGRGNKTTDKKSAVLPLVEPNSMPSLPPAAYSVDAAKRQQVSERTVRREVERAVKVPNIAKAIGTSLDRPAELDALKKLPTERQAAIIDRAAAGEKVSAKIEAKQVRRSEREAELADRTVAAAKQLKSQLYNVIYADPPWRWEPYSRETGMDRAADNHYPTMTLDDIKAIKPPAAEDCALFLWATAPMLPEALDLITSWGFIYKSHCVWSKVDRLGTGYWFRNTHELLLVATRGNIPAPAPGTQYPSLIEAETGRHSYKPDTFAEMIESLFPTVPKLEMFSRQSRSGWNVWGNEAPREENPERKDQV